MTVDWFLIDAPYVVPAEFSAWREAKKRHEDLFYRVLDTDINEQAELYVALERQALEARDEAGRLESAARDAWAQKR